MGILKNKKIFLAMGVLCSVVEASELSITTGVHDFVVPNIKNDGQLYHIPAGTSHTLGLNLGIDIKHTTASKINIHAKAETFYDRDKDELDNDHIPIWFKFLFEIDGDIVKLSENNYVKWQLLMDNKQNTVSCVERQVRQHIGVGYEYRNDAVKFDINAYSGFYYLEIDDDTPALRGYPRSNRLDNGEASNILEIGGSYRVDKDVEFALAVRHYAANAGFERLEDDVVAKASYKNAEFLSDGVSLHLKVEYSKYNFESYNVAGQVPILPWDSDMLVQFYAAIPLNY